MGIDGGMTYEDNNIMRGYITLLGSYLWTKTPNTFSKGINTFVTGVNLKWTLWYAWLGRMAAYFFFKCSFYQILGMISCVIMYYR